MRSISLGDRRRTAETCGRDRRPPSPGNLPWARWRLKRERPARIETCWPSAASSICTWAPSGSFGRCRERMRGHRRGGSGLGYAAATASDDRQVHVGRGQGKAAAFGLHQDVGRIGMVLRRSTTLCTCPKRAQQGSPVRWLVSWPYQTRLTTFRPSVRSRDLFGWVSGAGSRRPGPKIPDIGPRSLPVRSFHL